MTRAASPLLVLLLLVAGCAARTPLKGPETATDRPPPPMPEVAWTTPGPPTTSERDGLGHPTGFAVLDAERRAMPMTRLENGGDVELWRPDTPDGRSIPVDIDQDLVDRIDGRIAVVELSPSDAGSSQPIPRRRALDGILFTTVAGGPPRLAIVLGSLARFNPGERWLVESFLRRGFDVLLSSPPVAAPGRPPGDRAVLRPGIEPEIAGRTLAAEMDTAIAGWATSVDRLVESFHGDGLLDDGSTVLVGMSSGGLAAPAVAARLQARRPIAAAALVATGADPPTIVARTTLDDRDLRIDRQGPRIEDRDLARFRDAYLDRVRLDQAELHDWFAARPILVVEAGFDSAIPAAARAMLLDRFPSAAHWWLPAGHYGLFAALVQEADGIVGWLENRLEVPEPGTRP